MDANHTKKKQAAVETLARDILADGLTRVENNQDDTLSLWTFGDVHRGSMCWVFVSTEGLHLNG